MARNTILFLFCFICLHLVSAQTTEKQIQLSDEKTKEGLVGVNVQIKNEVLITDDQGFFILKSELLPAHVIISYIGYETYIANWTELTKIPEIIYLKETETALDIITVTGSKYEQNISKSAVSVDIIKTDLLRSVNATGSDKILNKVPGVQILDGQANIRGGSGYSYGAGSRVMLLLDDVPALQPDAGFPNWNDIPIENLSQIEILKGAASTLYGSAALNGIINFRSSYATSTPETRFSASMNVFLSPKDINKKWWGDTLRYENNFSFVHKQKFGKIDLIASGLFNKLEGFNQFTNETRGRGNINIRYRINDKLTLQLGTILNTGKSNSFFLWANPGSGAMRPLKGTVSDRKALRIYIDPSITYIDKWTNKHRLLSRTISVDNKNNTNQSNSSLNQYTEYQFQRKFEDLKLVLTSGLVGSWNKSDSQILGDTTFYSSNYAAYLQLDKTFGEKLTFAGGLRYEYVKHRSPEFFLGDTIPGGKASDGQLIGRLSANYQLAPYSFLRASFGQGYRYPTLTERFVTTTFGSFSIFANPSLRPEYGWSSELGFKQGIKIGGFEGFLDVAGFVSEYEDMIEFTFVFEPNRIGFQPQNVGNTRISGYEAGIMGKLKLFGVPVTIFGGYTFINPIYKNYDSSEQVRNSVSEPINVLKYRSKHQFKMDAEAKLWKFKLGFSIQRVSHIINVDKAFEAVPPVNIDLFGIGQYRDFNHNGYLLLDGRLGIELGKLTITTLINNILNTEYSLRPALIEAPRSVALRLDYKLN